MRDTLVANINIRQIRYALLPDVCNLGLMAIREMKLQKIAQICFAETLAIEQI